MSYENLEIKPIGYLTSALKAGVVAVRYILNLPEYKAIHGFEEIPVDMEAPYANVSYPYVHVIYSDKNITPIDLGAAGYKPSENSIEEFQCYKFDGTFTLNMYARSILERERIADCMMAAVAIDDKFAQKLEGNPWINLCPNMHTFNFGTANESWGTPWSADEMTAFRQMKFDVVGQFYFRKTSVAEYIESIRVDSKLNDIG